MKTQALSSILRRRRVSVVGLIGLIILFLLAMPVPRSAAPSSDTGEQPPTVLAQSIESQPLARDLLAELPVRGRASKVDYEREEFGAGWASIDGCDTRNIMLQRSLTDIDISDDDCTVLSGVLDDPYSGEMINFLRGRTTSDDVQIDHVVALSDAWQKGAQQLAFTDRVLLANDPLNLLAVDGTANQQKGDSDAASWLPSNTGYRCQYVARQIAVKQKHTLWVTAAEKAAMERILNGCGDQVIPLES